MATNWGTLGTLLTFFPFELAAAGRIGTGMAETTSFAIPDPVESCFSSEMILMALSNAFAAWNAGSRPCVSRKSMGIRDRPISPRSPWQNGIAESCVAFFPPMRRITINRARTYHYRKTRPCIEPPTGQSHLR